MRRIHGMTTNARHKDCANIALIAAISTVLADISTAIVFASIAYPILQNNGCVPGRSKLGMAILNTKKRH